MSEPTTVTLTDAYAEACLALGEATVQQRLMGKSASAQIDALTAQVAALTAAQLTPQTTGNELMLAKGNVRVYSTDVGLFVTSVDGYGWIEGSWATTEEALAGGQAFEREFPAQDPDPRA